MSKLEDQYPADVINCIGLPTPSPTLSVLREMTDDGRSFTLRHEPQAAPPAPAQPPMVRAGRRNHVFHSLTDGFGYVQMLVGLGVAANPVATVDLDANQVTIVLNELAMIERERVSIQLRMHERLRRWVEKQGAWMDHATWLRHLRENMRAITRADQETGEFLLGQYSALAGTLTHESDEFCDYQRTCATFTVRKKGRGAQPGLEQSVEHVPMAFVIAAPVLVDSRTDTTFRVIVFTRGSEGGQVQFSYLIEDLEDTRRSHIDEALQTLLNDSHGKRIIPWFLGTHRESPWSEPELPGSVKELMFLQTSQLAAIAAGMRPATTAPQPNERPGR